MYKDVSIFLDRCGLFSVNDRHQSRVPRSTWTPLVTRHVFSVVILINLLNDFQLVWMTQCDYFISIEIKTAPLPSTVNKHLISSFSPFCSISVIAAFWFPPISSLIRLTKYAFVAATPPCISTDLCGQAVANLPDASG